MLFRVSISRLTEAVEHLSRRGGAHESTLRRNSSLLLLPPLVSNNLFGGRCCNLPLPRLCEPSDEGFDRIRGCCLSLFTAGVREHSDAEVACWLNDSDCIERASASHVDARGSPVKILHAPAKPIVVGWRDWRSMQVFDGRGLQKRSIATL